MNKKQLIAALIACGVLVLAGVASLLKDSFSWQKATADRELMPSLDLNSIRKVVFSDGEATATLRSTQSGWKISERKDFAADLNRLSDFLHRLKVARLVQSLNVPDDKLALFDLTTPEKGQKGALRVDAFGQDDRPVFSLLMGKPHMAKSEQDDVSQFSFGQMPDGRYVSLSLAGGSRKVFLIGNIFESAAAAPGMWVDKDFPKADKMNLVVLKSDDKKLDWKLSRKDDKAAFELSDLASGQKANPQAVGSLVSAISNLSPADVNSAEEADLKRRAVLAASTFDGLIYKLEFFDGKDSKVYVRPEVSTKKTDLPKEAKERLEKDKFLNGVFCEIAKNSADAILKSKSDLLEQPKPQASAATAPASAQDQKTAPKKAKK